MTNYTVVNVTSGHCASVAADTAQQALARGQRALARAHDCRMAGQFPRTENCVVRLDGADCDVDYDAAAG